MKKVVSIALVLMLFASLLAGCGAKYTSLSADVQGDITIALWSGDGSYLEDVGHQNYAPEELHSQNIAAAYATAKAFNQIYPNVKINVFAKAGGPDDNKSWTQELEDFKAEHGKYPDVWASTDLVGEISKGMIADLSRFSGDPLYKNFNKSVMNIMNLEGFQAGLPQYLLPWGVFVNKSLAEDNNLDVPSPDWNLDEYTSFIRQADMKNFYGSMDVPMAFINTGTKSIRYQMLNRKAGESYVNLDSYEVKDLIDYIPKWADYSIWPQRDLEKIPVEVMDENGWWSYNFFKNGKLLTLDGDPWMMGDAAHPDPTHWGKVQADDWDIYPRPSTPYQPNTVGIVVDPIVVYNYAMDDGNYELSEDELAKMQIAYTFASFWVGDSKALQARAEQMFNDQGVLKTCLNDSFPLVTGDEFQKQMNIWYTTDTHKRFADKAKMPGFHKVLEIWEKGQYWDVSDKTYPYFHDFEGTKRVNLYEWDNYWNPDITGARRTDANYVDVLKSKLSDWNEATNQRFEDSANGMKDGLKKYYGYKDSDFK